MLSDEFTAVSISRNRDDLSCAVLRFAHRLEFDRMTASAVLDHCDAPTTFRSVDNPPPAYGADHEDPAQGRRDPVMQHCKVFGTPILWSQRTYVSAGRADKWERQAPHGYRTGIALALHLPLGRHFFIGLDRYRDLPSRASTVTRMVADLHLFAALAYDAAFRVLYPEAVASQRTTQLTPRELETLRWTMEGKTAWEVGKILSISEQTAIKHASSAARKLGCINKHQAALKALRLGLIH